ncbi:MAG: GNAT family N-acetyltransferase [Gammaproteobacteria bacterium]|nr:GNAT family N-acetyltransferase [Gammaproteobacteria bacterium]
MNKMTNTFQFVEITKDEHNDFLLFLISVFEKMDTDKLKFNLDQSKYAYSLQNNKGEIIGGCWIRNFQINRYNIGGIGGVGIKSNYREKGLSRLLLERTINQTSGLYDAYLVWTRSPAFFVKFGFEIFSRGIETQEGDSTPMLLPFHPELKDFAPSPQWPRIHF